MEIILLFVGEQVRIDKKQLLIVLEQFLVV